ncbi:MAG: hypothetical protein JJ902_05580 [Roseibium sp.]|nr:hypothetical protein [Roseibium sp.]
MFEPGDIVECTRFEISEAAKRRVAQYPRWFKLSPLLTPMAKKLDRGSK